MIDRVLLILIAACAILLGQIAAELLRSEPALSDPDPPSMLLRSAEAVPARAAPKVEELAMAALKAPLFSPTRRPPEQAEPEPAQELPDMRLAATIIEPGRRIAIFAIPGAKPLVRSEGEALNGWRIENILPHAVSLIGAAGSRTIEAKPDQSLKRQPFVADGPPRQPVAVPPRPALAVPGGNATPLAPMPPLQSSGQGVRSVPNNARRP